MKRSELNYPYPEELVGVTPVYPPRVLFCSPQNTAEISWDQLLKQFQPGDVLVLNDTKVLKRRIFTEEGLEILFLGPAAKFESNSNSEPAYIYWEALFPSKKLTVGDKIKLPFGVEAELVQKGRPQILKLNQPVNENYFEKNGELPLPPYIQRARDQRHNQEDDQKNYQTVWAKKPGSLAAPTASLHLKEQDLEKLKASGVEILKVTLHVGLGTFLPITAEDLKDHVMHSEYVEISNSVWQKIKKAKQDAKTVWSLGTTVTRTLESQALGFFKQNQNQDWVGTTDLLIKPGFEFKIVDKLLTNFHQPESTLIALVAAFAGLDNVKAAYAQAIEKKMRLFSYGDLSVWTK